MTTFELSEPATARPRSGASPAEALANSMSAKRSIAPSIVFSAWRAVVVSTSRCHEDCSTPTICWSASKKEA